MANKQALPNLNLDNKVSMINSPGANRVIAPEWKEQQFKTLSQITNGIIGVSDAYRNIKHTEMLAKMDNIAQQEMFKLSNANDPCEIPEIINNSYKTFDEMYKDDPYGKSFYKSKMYEKFRTKYEANIIKENLNLQKKFDLIQASRTGNEISSDIALMGDPERMSGAFNSYVAQIKHLNLDPLEEEKLITQVAKDSFGKVFTNDPNNAVNWYNYSNGAFDKYGVDGNEIKEKAKEYYKSLASERLTLENKLAQAKERQENSQLEHLKSLARQGGSISELQKKADEISPRVGNLFYSDTKEKDFTSELQKREISKIFNSDKYTSSEKIKLYDEFVLSNPEITSSARAYGNDIAKKYQGTNDFTSEQISMLDDILTGKNEITAEEANKQFDDNPKLLSEVLKNIRTRDKETETEAEKEKTKKSKNEAIRLTNLAKNGNIEKAIDGLKNIELEPEGKEKVWNAIFTELDKTQKESKAKRENELTQKILNIIDNGYVLSDDELVSISSKISKDNMNLIRSRQKAIVEQKEKDIEARELNSAKLNVIEAQSEEDLYQAMTDNATLSPENYKELITEFKSKKNELEAISKEKSTENRTKAQNVALQSILNSIEKNQIPDEKQMENLSLILRPGQMTTLRSAISSRKTQLKKEHNSFLTRKIYEAWEGGKAVNPNVIENFDDLSQEETRVWLDKIIAKNKEIYQKGYDLNFAKIQDGIWKSNVMPDDEQVRKYAQGLSKYGVKDEATIYNDINNVITAKQNDTNNAIKSANDTLDNIWIPVTNKESDVEKLAKTNAKSYIFAQLTDGKKIDYNDIVGIVNRFRPTKDDINSIGMDKEDTKLSIEAQRDDVFEYDEDKKDTYTKGYELNVDIDNMGRVFDYVNRTRYALETEYISPSEYAEYMTPVRLKQGEIIKKALKYPNYVVGYVMTNVKSKIKNIKDGELMVVTSSVLNFMLGSNVRYNMSVTDRAWKIDSDLLNASQQNTLNKTIDEVLSIKYGYEGATSDVIVLRDGTEIENGSVKNGTKSN